MALDVAGIVAQLASQALSLGVFEDVVTVEPKSAPGDGVFLAIWVQGITPVPGGSGLASLSVDLVFQARIMKRMLSQPYGQIDPDMLAACDALMRAYAGAFTLGGEVRDVDLLGMYGTKLEAKAGYLTLDKALFRVMDITLPLVINDLWAEVP